MEIRDWKKANNRNRRSPFASIFYGNGVIIFTRADVLTSIENGEFIMHALSLPRVSILIAMETKCRDEDSWSCIYRVVESVNLKGALFQSPR